jgi:RES domain
VRDENVEEFLRIVLDTTEKRIETVPSDSFVWRAQLGNCSKPRYQDNEHVTDDPVPYPPNRMKPLKDRAKEGRANPKGIPYLYVATDPETAAAEVRPWVGSLISVGQFKISRPLRVVNCTTHDKATLISVGGEPSPEKREESVWSSIDKAFATPVMPADDLADYAPTQIIAELFKMHKFDGIRYRSSLGSGHNIALFDLCAADLIDRFLFEIESVKFKAKKTTNPYWAATADAEC